MSDSGQTFADLCAWLETPGRAYQVQQSRDGNGIVTTRVDLIEDDKPPIWSAVGALEPASALAIVLGTVLAIARQRAAAVTPPAKEA